MNKSLAAVFLALACSGAHAATWPWQNSSTGHAPDYCMGLVVGGLSSKQVAGMSRSELWQAWSYLIRTGALAQVGPTEGYKAGLSRFQNATDAESAEAVLKDAVGDCGIGRRGFQITGW